MRFLMVLVSKSLTPYWIALWGCLQLSAEPKPTLSTADLEKALGENISKVEQFRFIQDEAKRLEVRAWLFGGTAASYAHYVKADQLRILGDTRFQEGKFRFNFYDIFLPTQDVDIVIDGTEAQAAVLEKILIERYPCFQGPKADWEVRLLDKPRGEKDPIQGNWNFANQNTDSQSIGLIEITEPKQGDPRVKQARDSEPSIPSFLSDVIDGRIHLYRSAAHRQTSRFQEGKNPEIFAVIRFLAKAFQHELEIPADEKKTLKEIVDQFDPARDLRMPYARNWLEKNAKKIYQNASDLEYAATVMKEVGLVEKLQRIGDRNQEGSMSWWMSREPLPSMPVGIKGGKTAADLKIDVVAHETTDLFAYDSITRSRKECPNVFESREGFRGESASFGKGFYTKRGREGARGTGITIRFRVKSAAREGYDFLYFPKTDYVLFLNKEAFEVIPEDLDMGIVDYFRLLSENKTLDHTDRGLLEKFKLRMGADLTPNSKEAQEIFQIVRKTVNSDSPNTALVSEWLSLPASKHFTFTPYECLRVPVLVPGIFHKDGDFSEMLDRSLSESPPTPADLSFIEKALESAIHSISREQREMLKGGVPLQYGPLQARSLLGVMWMKTALKLNKPFSLLMEYFYKLGDVGLAFDIHYEPFFRELQRWLERRPLSAEEKEQIEAWFKEAQKPRDFYRDKYDWRHSYWAMENAYPYIRDFFIALWMKMIPVYSSSPADYFRMWRVMDGSGLRQHFQLESVRAAMVERLKTLIVSGKDIEEIEKIVCDAFDFNRYTRGDLNLVEFWLAVPPKLIPQSEAMKDLLTKYSTMSWSQSREVYDRLFGGLDVEKDLDTIDDYASRVCRQASDTSIIEREILSKPYSIRLKKTWPVYLDHVFNSNNSAYRFFKNILSKPHMAAREDLILYAIRKLDSMFEFDRKVATENMIHALFQPHLLPLVDAKLELLDQIGDWKEGRKMFLDYLDKGSFADLRRLTRFFGRRSVAWYPNSSVGSFRFRNTRMGGHEFYRSPEAELLRQAAKTGMGKRCEGPLQGLGE